MSRHHHQHGSEPTQRMLRVAELIRHAMSDLFSRGAIEDPALVARVVSVPRVKMSPDLKLATVFVMPLGGDGAKAVIDALDRHRKFLRTEIAHRINLKFAPDLRFRLDDSFEKMAQIDALLSSDKVRQDLEVPSDPEDEPGRDRRTE